jgi:predicted DNA-binding protein with PD1-like motif
MKHLVLTMLLVVSAGAVALAQSTRKTQAPMKKYTRVPAGYLMVLRQGDSILNEIEALAQVEKIPSATFSGMGFVNITFGFFDFKTRQYDPKEFRDVELASMQGTIAWQKGKVSLHAHGVVTDKTFQAYGGHILKGAVGTGSVEILVTVHDQRLERVFEDALGANVLSLEGTR